jgi:hypothetical protein
MRHIKLFEDYSDEEIEGLLGDLETIGHKPQLYKGKDFGFKKTLDGENNGVSYLYFTPEGMAFLIENGVVGKDLEINKDYMGSIKGPYGDKKVSGKFIPCTKYNNEFEGYHIGIETTSGRIQEWPETYYSERFRRPSIAKILNGFVNKIEKIRK